MKKTILFITIVAFLFALACSSPVHKIQVVVVFDVEDYITPASEGIDDIPKWLAEIMSEEGVTGTFFMIGEKARSLEKRGRRDVIEAMAKHDIGSHTNFGSIHPTVAERLEKAGWDEGVREMMENESAGFKDLERIFQRPISILAKHGGSYGPQLVGALGKMKAGFVYSPVHLPKKNAVWFCNALNFHGEIAGFDNLYYRDDLFEPFFDSLKVQFPKLIEGLDVVTVFACHPCKIRTEQFWDYSFYYGVNPDSGQWRIPDLRPLESMETAKKNFRRLMRFLKDRDDIEVTTYRHVMDLYSKQRKDITAEDLSRIAQRTADENAIGLDDYFSAAEAFAGFIESLIQYQSKGSLPKRLTKISPLGPIEMPPAEPEISKIAFEQVCELAQEANRYIEDHGKLPSSLKINGWCIGTGSLFDLFSRAYQDLHSGRKAAEYSVRAFDAYPKTNEEAIIEEVEGNKGWIVHRPDLDMSHIVELTRCQLWTLKPATID